MSGAQAVIVTNGEVPVEGRAAVPVYVDDTLPMIGPARNVIVVTSGPMAGGPAMPVRSAAGTGLPGVGPALPVYVVSGSLSSAASASGLLTGLISYWQLEEASGTRVDAVTATGNDLTDNNTVTQAVGKVGNAAQFTAANLESLSRADNASLSIGGVSFTFAFWVYLDTLAAARMFICKDTGSNPNREYNCYVTAAGAVNVEMFAAAGNATVASANGTITTGSWFFIVCWWDSTDSKVRLSVNNGATLTSVGTVTVQDSSTAFGIGARQPGSGQPMDGRIDEVGFWKRTLTATERTNLYNSGNGVTYPFTGVP